MQNLVPKTTSKENEADEDDKQVLQALSHRVSNIEINSNVASYLLTWGANISAGYNDSIARRNLSVKNGIGIIHLDFNAAVSKGNVIIATLPVEAPVFEMNCDVNIASGGHIWINKGQRAITAAGIQANTRIIVDIIGFVK